MSHQTKYNFYKMQPEEVDASSLARKCQRVYECFRGRSAPGYKCGKKFDSEWFKLANTLIRLKADPVTYLESLFECWGGAPFVNQLCSPRAQSIYNNYLNKGKTIGELEFTNQIRYLNDAIAFYTKTHGEVDNILGLDFVPVKAYIRILLCSEDVLPEFLERYGATAYAEVKANPSIDKYIKDTYVSRYNRLFPQRLSEVDDSAHDTLPEPSKVPARRQIYPQRRRATDS